MVSKNKKCLFCKQESKNLNSVNLGDLELLFNQIVDIYACNLCLGKIDLISQFCKSVKKSTKYVKKSSCSVCEKKSLYLFDVKKNSSVEDSFLQKFTYCRIQRSTAVITNVCYQCLYLTDLWFQLKKQSENVEKEDYSTPISSNSIKTPDKNLKTDLKRKLYISGSNKEQKTEIKSPQMPNKRSKKDSISSNVSEPSEEIGVKRLTPKKGKMNNLVKKGRYETVTVEPKKGVKKTIPVTDKIKKLQRQLQLDIRNADTFCKSTKLKDGRNSGANDHSMNESMKEETVINRLQPTSAYFTKKGKKWLKPQIRSDTKMLNEICLVDLSSSSITAKVLKRLEERHSVRVKVVTSENETPEPPSPEPKKVARQPSSAQRSKSKVKKYTAARKFATDVPKSKHKLERMGLDEIRSYRSSMSPPLRRKTPESDRTDFDYGMNRQSYDAFSADREKVVMVLLHNVDELEKSKKRRKEKSDETVSISSSSSGKTEFDLDDDEEKRQEGKFACLENYMAGLPHLILNRMYNSDENIDNTKEVLKNGTTERYSQREKTNGIQDSEEYVLPEPITPLNRLNKSNLDNSKQITPEKSTNMEKIDQTTSKQSPIKSNLDNLEQTTSKNNSNTDKIDQTTNNLLKSNSKNVPPENIHESDKNDDNNSAESNSQSDCMELRLSEEDSDKQNGDSSFKNINKHSSPSSSCVADKSNTIIRGNDIISLDSPEEIVVVEENTTTTTISEETVENNQANSQKKTTASDNSNATITGDDDDEEEVVVGTYVSVDSSEQAFCEVAQKLAELDA